MTTCYVGSPQWVLVHMSQSDDGGGDSNNIVIISSLHLILY